MKDKFLIIDGHNLLFQMFFGMPSRIVSRDGKAIQGVIGFVGALIKIIKQINPQYVVVLFDGEHENKQADILPEYKANRIDYSLVEDTDNLDREESNIRRHVANVFWKIRLIWRITCKKCTLIM